MPRNVLITGAYGYVGSVLRTRLEDAGWTTTALVRTPRDGDRAHAWQLGHDVDDAVWDGVYALVHCAYDLTLRSRADIRRVNVEGSARLLEAAARAGVPRLLVISSMSAYPGTAQLYGTAKLEIERVTLGLGGVAVRPGLVYGPHPGGMAGTLQGLTRLPVIPVLSGGGRQYPVHEDDLADAVTRVLSGSEWVPEIIGVAQPEPIPLRDVVAGLAALQGRTCRFVPVPWRAVDAALRLAEALHLPVPLRSDSIAGLIHPAPSVPVSSAHPGIPVSLRTLGASGVRPAADGKVGVAR